MNQSVFEEYVLSLSEVIERSVKDGLTIFKTKAGEKIFLVIHDQSSPLRIEVGVDERLSGLLQERYETIMASKTMNPKTWVEVICSGQLNESEIKDLIRLSYGFALRRKEDEQST